MSDSVNQIFSVLSTLPFSKKVSIAFVLCILVAGFAFMFLWANQVDHQVLYSNLSPEDAGAIVAKLKEKNIIYKVEANGTMVTVPAEKVHDLRLSLASDGLPNGGNVGFEIFDKTDFRTTKFVQELNYRRALQGELGRTINQFKEIKGSRVFIVLPKESLFVEETNAASASIQLDLRSNLPPGKLTAITHLVANAVEGLDPGRVTVVDTRGRVLFKGMRSDDATGLLDSAQLDYKGKLESKISRNVQTMLEGIVGPGKAIIRVNAEIDFDKVTLNQEEYDPSSSAVRSSKNIEESVQAGTKDQTSSKALVGQRKGVVGPSTAAQQMRSKKNVTTNYEINRVTKTVLKPAGDIRRLSVAAVIDGRYKAEKMKDGTSKNEYAPRSEEELKKFEEMVKKAMGYNEDRGDQVVVNSMEFSKSAPVETTVMMEEEGFDFLKMVGAYKNMLINLALGILAFFLVVRPLLRSLKNITKEAVSSYNELGPVGGEQAQIPGAGGQVQIPGAGGQVQIPGAGEPQRKELAMEISRSSPERTQQLIKGWIGEQE